MARTWFHCSVQEMLDRVDSAELGEYRAIYELGPWCEWRADMRNAMNCTAVMKAAGAKDVRPSDWMPSFGVESNEDEGRMREALLAAVGGKIERK